MRPGTVKDSSARYWNRTARRYARRPVADVAAYERKLEFTRACLGPDMDALEFGCGTGSTAIAIAADVKRILAIDVSAEMIRIAREKAAAAETPNVAFETGAFARFEAPDGAFDAVLGLNVLHLLDDWPAAIAKAYRLLKPGGVFVTSTACLADDMNWLRWIVPAGKALGLLPRVVFFSEATLLNTMKGAGFEIERSWKP
ncbi:MAG: class I SAM-dependent methyltransferase, partial [Alphaproteobacteria bacterium]